MTLDQLAASLQASAKPAATSDAAADSSPPFVHIVANLVTTTEATHLIDLNGAQYEIASGDVIDIQFPSLNTTAPTVAESRAPEGEQAPPNEEAKEQPAEARADKEESLEPRLAFIKINPNALLTQRVQVPAIVVAAAGTWLAIVPGTGQAA